MNLQRYAMPLRTILARNPHSILHKLAEGTSSQAKSYTRHLTQTFLSPVEHPYLIDQEGYLSEKILRDLMGNRLRRDRANIKLTKSGAISFSDDNLKYIADKYPHQYRKFIRRCVGRTGLHGLTHQYSVINRIESDHTIPHQVWKSTTNRKLKRFVRGGGSRPGEKDMPAMTIPYGLHRKLRTTGRSDDAIYFRKRLVGYCNDKRIDKALYYCFLEYKKCGMDLNAYKKPIILNLNEHVKLNIITQEEKLRILSSLYR